MCCTPALFHTHRLPVNTHTLPHYLAPGVYTTVHPPGTLPHTLAPGDIYYCTPTDFSGVLYCPVLYTPGTLPHTLAPGDTIVHPLTLVEYCIVLYTHLAPSHTLWPQGIYYCTPTDSLVEYLYTHLAPWGYYCTPTLICLFTMPSSCVVDSCCIIKVIANFFKSP